MNNVRHEAIVVGRPDVQQGLLAKRGAARNDSYFELRDARSRIRGSSSKDERQTVWIRGEHLVTASDVDGDLGPVRSIQVWLPAQ